MSLSNGVILLFFIIALVLFFWGSFKAAKTQNTHYLWAMIPVFVFIAMMLV